MWCANLAPAGPWRRWNRVSAEYSATAPPFEKPITAIREGSIRGCVTRSSRAR